MPRLAAHLLAHGVLTEIYATRWFVGLFSGSLPTETTLRVWDCLVVEGVEVRTAFCARTRATSLIAQERPVPPP